MLNRHGCSWEELSKGVTFRLWVLDRFAALDHCDVFVRGKQVTFGKRLLDQTQIERDWVIPQSLADFIDAQLAPV
ncbi:MAG: hypothetical protein L6Q76_34985, partial [Polyangiaceae bacterium]|nr:hypothetical protein [Polyangiaceae bacterium]